MHSRIASKLLRVIFALYFTVSVTVTGFQMYMDYALESDAVATEIEQFSQIISPTLSAIIWNLDNVQLELSLGGILKNPSVVGIEVIEEYGGVVHAVGIVSEVGQSRGDNTHDIDGVGTLYPYQFPLEYWDAEIGSKEKVGSVTYYSAFGVVISRVKYTLILTLVNAIVKTFALWLIFYFVVRSVVGIPLSNLTMDMERFRLSRVGPKGEYKAKEALVDSIGLDSKENELDMVKTTFHKMKEELLGQEKLLRDYNVELEQKVEDRTKEIRFVNQELTDALAMSQKAKEAAEAANKSKSLFLANMSHEIRTPLSGILGFTEMVLGDDLSAETRESVETINTCSTTLLELINDILDLAKIEADKIDLESISFNLEDIIYKS